MFNNIRNTNEQFKKILKFRIQFYNLKDQAMGKLSIIILLLIIKICTTLVNQRKLLLVQETARHGSTKPQYSLKRDDFSSVSQSFIRESEGELTKVGHSMHYKLGKILYQKYWQKLFNSTEFQKNYHQSKFYIKSTNYKKTIQSAQSQLMGLLGNLPPLELDRNQLNFSIPPWISQQIKNNINFQASENVKIFNKNGYKYHPTVVHTDKSTTKKINFDDYLLAGLQTNCPFQIQNIAQNFNSKLAKEIKCHPKMISAHRALQQYFNTSIDFWEIYKYYANYKALKATRQPYATIFQHPQHRQAYEFLGKFTIYLKYFSTKMQIKIAGSQFFKQILGVMDKAIQSAQTGYPYNIQFQLFLGHDVTVATILSALNFTSPKCIWDTYRSIYCGVFCIDKEIDFATNILLQLWKQQDNSIYSVGFRFNGQLMLIPFCQRSMNENCQYSTFKNYITQNIIINEEELQYACLMITDYFYIHLQIALSLVILTLIIVVLDNKSRQKHKQQIKVKIETNTEQKLNDNIPQTQNIK